MVGLLEPDRRVAVRGRRRLRRSGAAAGGTGAQRGVRCGLRDGLRAVARGHHVEPGHLVFRIAGVGLANSMLVGGREFGDGVNWAKAREVGISLLVSPIVGFVLAALLLLLCK